MPAQIVPAIRCNCLFVPHKQFSLLSGLEQLQTNYLIKKSNTYMQYSIFYFGLYDNTGFLRRYFNLINSTPFYSVVDKGIKHI